ncbi:hypothetical protein GDO81_027139 [Engystomops pustulosus]|uniref:Uncharacterized protein n=1 Tax=Engystomops pustulosus TaxID=76066 RepID=A0AAV6YMS4_ENGPU|nr:hypothetical protein GDO81_027139 [Engystomops pustulosus]
MTYMCKNAQKIQAFLMAIHHHHHQCASVTVHFSLLREKRGTRAGSNMCVSCDISVHGPYLHTHHHYIYKPPKCHMTHQTQTRTSNAVHDWGT